MRDFKNDNPVFKDTIKIVETTDPVHADGINSPLKQIYENTMANKKRLDDADDMKGAAGGVATLDGSGHIPDVQLNLAERTVTGVKGAKESNYRKGQVNITPADIGASPDTHTHDYANITGLQAELNKKIDVSKIGENGGVASLGTDGKVPQAQLPSYVDDVIEGYLHTDGKFYKEATHVNQITAESGKIYVDISSGKTYRWSGSAYVVISETLALGITSSTAFAGDKGNAAYLHAVTKKGKAFASNLYKITTNEEGHVTAAAAATKDDITKLGIPGTDTKYTHPTSDGSKHVPATGTTNDGKVLAAGSAAGSFAWKAPADLKETFSSGDVADANAPTSWSAVNPLVSGDTHATLFNKISTMLKNIRFLWKLMGTASIADIGDGTVRGAISKLNTDIAGVSGFKICGGTVQMKVEKVNVSVNKQINFPAGKFTANPLIFVTAQTSAPDKVFAGAVVISKDAFILYFTRPDLTLTTINWVAIGN